MKLRRRLILSAEVDARSQKGRQTSYIPAKPVTAGIMEHRFNSWSTGQSGSETG
jgi:hypothetical protein